MGGLLESKCSCCQPIGQQLLSVPLSCPDGHRRVVRLPVPTSCSCEACLHQSEPAALPLPAKHPWGAESKWGEYCRRPEGRASRCSGNDNWRQPTISGNDTWRHFRKGYFRRHTLIKKCRRLCSLMSNLTHIISSQSVFQDSNIICNFDAC